MSSNPVLGEESVSSLGHALRSPRPYGMGVKQPYTMPHDMVCEHRSGGDAAPVNSEKIKGEPEGSDRQ